MARIFISYKRVDKEKVFRIKDQIESALGEKCWIDLDGIESDAQFKNVIIRAINACEIVLFMYSKAHSKIVDFEKDWTVRELNFASKKKKRIVFINLDGSPLTDAFEFDYGTKQQVDASSEERVLKLLYDLRNWMGINYKESNSSNNEEGKNDVIGALIYGDTDIYRVVELIGKGSTGKVYKGYSVKTKITYAIKQLDIIDLHEYRSLSVDSIAFHGSSNKEDLEEWTLLMRNSSAMLSNLHQDNLADIVAYVEMPESCVENSISGRFCIMEYIEGENLSDYINNNPLTEQDAVLIIRQLCKALGFLHKYGILHLDVKPSNIIYNPKTKKATLIDYSTSLCSRRLQDTTKIWVTAGYIPFDISNHTFLQKEKINESVDTYSIGATLFTLLTNERPPSGLDLRVAPDSIEYPLSLFNTTPELCKIIEHAMADDENVRYQCVDEIIGDLNSLPTLSKEPHYAPLSKEEIGKRNKKASTTILVEKRTKNNIIY